MLIFADNDARAPVRKLANQFGLDFEQPGYEMRDYQQEANHGSDQVVTSRNMFQPLAENEHLFGKFDQQSQGVHFQGIGAVIDPKNKFVFPVLRAEKTSFSVNRKDINQVSSYSGEQLTLVAAYQTRQNSRVAFSGSLKMCSNDFILKSAQATNGTHQSENLNFCNKLAEWTFKETGVVRVSNMRHNKKGETWNGENP